MTDDDLRMMLLIRHFELALLDLFARGEIAGTTHTCLGQEAVPVTLRPLLHPDDFVFSNHRGHGHYLARFDDPAGLLAEIMGRDGGVSGGTGGSQHLRRGRYLSTGVQGESLPVAAGTALHLAHHEPGRLACVHMGDGTWGEGAVYEALNMAALWRLPLLVAVEHNAIAQSTRTGAAMAGTIAGRAAAFGVAHVHVDAVGTDDPWALRTVLAGPVGRVRDGAGPLVVEFATQRIGPHSKGDDPRPPDEIDRLRAGDWYGRLDDPDFQQLDAEVRARVADVVREVTARPPATGRAPAEEESWQHASV